MDSDNPITPAEVVKMLLQDEQKAANKVEYDRIAAENDKSLQAMHAELVAGNRIYVTKHVREMTGLGLKGAKGIVDTLINGGMRQAIRIIDMMARGETLNFSVPMQGQLIESMEAFVKKARPTQAETEA